MYSATATVSACSKSDRRFVPGQARADQHVPPGRAVRCRREAGSGRQPCVPRRFGIWQLAQLVSYRALPLTSTSGDATGRVHQNAIAPLAAGRPFLVRPGPVGPAPGRPAPGLAFAQRVNAVVHTPTQTRARTSLLDCMPDLASSWFWKAYASCRTSAQRSVCSGYAPARVRTLWPPAYRAHAGPGWAWRSASRSCHSAARKSHCSTG